MVSARWRGSSASGASGRPCATSQNGQRRVQMSPRIMKVAVPLPKHSAMFGHEASSQTVCSFCSRKICLITPKRELALAARTRIHGGLGSGACGTMRIVFRAPFSLAPASRIFNSLGKQSCQPVADFLLRNRKSKIFHLRDSETGKTARIDRGEAGKVHIDMERKAMIAAPARYSYSERGKLGAADVHPGRGHLA